MSKRKIALICIVSLLATLVTGCGLGKKETIVSPEPTETVTQQPAPENTPVADEHPAEKDYSIVLEGTEETVPMQLCELSFADEGGPEIGIYVDYAIYEPSSSDYSWLIVPFDADVVTSYIEIDYFTDISVDDLAAQIFDNYDAVITAEDMGECELENCYARFVKGQAEDGSSWYAYIIETEAGLITEVVRVDPEAVEGHGPRLLASADTLFVK